MRLHDRHVAFAVGVLLAACGGHAVNESSSGPGGPPGTPAGSGAKSSGDAGHSAGGAAGVAPRTDAGIGGAPSGESDASAALPPGFPAPTRPLSSLNESESKAFCQQDARRSDPCILEGMQAHDSATCTARVAMCRASLTTTQVGAGCDAPQDLSKCSITVQQYFDCLDAWSRVYVCDNAGYEIDTPKACEAVRDCGLTDQGNQDFMQLGKPPSCDPNSPPRPPDNDVIGLDGCAPRPAKLVALGNSIAACVDKPGCAPEQLADYVRKQYAPSLTYENHAANASDLTDLLRQASQVESGPGHVAVWLFAFPSDPTSLALDTWKTRMNTLMDYFADPGRFPDGATFMVNTQFNPSDECFLVGPAYASDPISPEEQKALQTINRELFIELGTSRKDTVTIDEYPDFLGHASHADMRGCPYCSTDNTSWVADSVHPNDAGYDHIFQKWKIVVDEMYGGKCTQ